MLIIYSALSSILLLFTIENIIYNGDNTIDAKNLFSKSFIISQLSNFLIMFLLSMGLANLTKSLLATHFLLFIVFAIIGVLNYQMLYYRNEYLKPIDLKLFSESKEISKSIEVKVPTAIYINTFCNILYMGLLFFMEDKFSYSYVYLLSFIALGVFIYIIQSDDFCIKKLHIKIDKFSDFNDFKNNGFIFTFIRNLNTFKLKTPKDYTQGISKELLEDIETSEPNKKPNIIVIMNESFFNVNEIKDLELSSNPLEHFEHIIQNYTNGSVISPVIGGGTCQPEYEMLTGNSVIFTYKYKIAFLEFFKDIKKRTVSIASVLKKQNYSSVFIHPFRKEFYNRNNAYTSFGFEKIIDIKDFDNPYKPRSFVSDMDCYKKLINEFENKSDEKPFFSMVVTMQNHPGYLDGQKFDKHNISVLNDSINSDEKTMLENYVNLLKESDNAIKFLTDYFQNKEDTVILFFGDHQTTKNIGFSSITKRSELELSKTPFFIWDNYYLEKTNYNYVSSFYLTPILFNSIDFKSDKYFNYLYEKLSYFKAFNTGFVIDANDNYINKKDINPELKELFKELELIQFDRL